jgi:PAS domain S-box-containing protein
MLDRIRTHLAPPIFEGDEDRTRIAGLLNVILCSMFVIGLIFMPIGALNKGGYPGVLIITGILSALAPVMLWMLRRGYVESVSVLLVSLLFVAAIGFVFVVGSIRVPIASLFILCVVIAGLLMGHRGTIVVTVLSLVALLGLWLAETAGLLLPFIYGAAGFAPWLTLAVLLFSTAGLVDLATRGLSDALERVRHSERALTESNRRLKAEIAERTLAEEEVRTSSERLKEFKDIIDRSPALVFVWRTSPGEWPVEFVSDNVKQVLGYAVDDFMSGRVSWPGITYPEDIPRLEAEVARYLKEGVTEWSQEYRLMTKSGDVRWFSDRNLALPDSKEEITHIQSIVLDITDRKRMEEALRESEEKYKTLAEQSLQGTFVVQDMHIVFCNQTFANMGGWTIPEVLSWSPEQVTNMVHPDDQKRVWGRFRERLEGKLLPLTNNELRAPRKDGSIACIEYDARRINYGGRPAMLISVLDITQRREAERALRESEQRYRQLAESAQDFIYIIDKESKVQYVNSSGAKEFGCNPDQMRGRSVKELFPPETARRQWGDIQKVIQSGHALPNIETKVIFPKREMWLNTSLVPLQTESGEVTQVLGISRDVTEFKQAEEALRESEKRYRQLSEENARLLEQARQNAQTKTILLHEVNHRVKNNLASIIGLIQAHGRFRSKKGSPEFQSMFTDLAGRIQGLAMAHNLLSAAGWSSIKLADLATEVIHSTLQILPPDHRVSIHVSPSSVQVTPDQANTLALVINELATNTIKHGRREKEAATISVWIEENDGQILFEFQDNGPGYPEPILGEEHYNVGLRLVTNLVRRELRGEVTLRNDHGAVTRIQFGNRRS